MFDAKEAMKSGTFICGMTGSGKSDLAMRFAEGMMQQGILVCVFDPSQAWQKQSNIPKVATIQNADSIWLPKESTIFDISMLTILDQQIFVEAFCKKLFMHRAISVIDPPTWLVFEEAHLYIPQGALRAKAFQEAVRVLSVGRNYNIKFCLVTPFASQVDKYAIKLCGQRYFGYTCETNDIKYLKGFLDERIEEVKQLQAGEFLRECRGDKNLVHSQPYQAVRIPQPSIPPPISIMRHIGQPKSHIRWWILGWGAFLFALMLILM